MDNPAECQEILRKYGYPLDKQEKATQTVFEQAELVATDWVAIEKEPGEIQRHRLKAGQKKERDRYETYPQRNRVVALARSRIFFVRSRTRIRGLPKI